MKKIVMVGVVAALWTSIAWGQETLSLPFSTTDEQLAEKLKGLTNLETLWLGQTLVTDAGLVHLKELANLEVLVLISTKITDAGVQDLQKALPGCNIRR